MTDDYPHPVSQKYGRPKTIEYMACECGFSKENTMDNGPVIEPGHYCPRCGEQITEYNMLRRTAATRIRKSVFGGERE